MKKIRICSTGLIITVLLLLLLPAGSFAAISNFNDTVVPEEGFIGIDTPWVHTLEPADFGLSSLDGVVITDATLEVNLYAPWPCKGKKMPIFLVGLAGEDTYLGGEFYKRHNSLYTFTLTPNALNLLNESYDSVSDCFGLSMVVFNPVGTPSVVITRAELSGSAHTPIPSAALLLGTGLIGLITFRRQRMKF